MSNLFIIRLDSLAGDARIGWFGQNAKFQILKLKRSKRRHNHFGRILISLLNIPQTSCRAIYHNGKCSIHVIRYSVDNMVQNSWSFH